jgi:hypothetical protein
MGAYQCALDLKPNYVRAWCNMGRGLHSFTFQLNLSAFMGQGVLVGVV